MLPHKLRANKNQQQVAQVRVAHGELGIHGVSFTCFDGLHDGYVHGWYFTCFHAYHGVDLVPEGSSHALVNLY